MTRPTAKKVVRVFLDSNVILSGLISDQGAPRIILDLLSLRLPFLLGMTCRYNLLEIERNSLKKLPGALPVYRVLIRKLRLKILPLPAMEQVQNLTGLIAAKDAPVLAVAIKGKAHFLVTGDKKGFDKLKAGDMYSFKIVTPTELLDAIHVEIVKRTDGG